MAELMTALYHNEPICIFDIVDENGQYIEEMRSEYRKASQANELHCPECNGTLELCAGVIIAPYFRHKSISDCPVTREMKTEAGKRSYFGKKMLYLLGKTAQDADIVVKEGKSNLPFHPVLLNSKDKEEAFLYLDGKSRNYEELKHAQNIYEKEQIKPFWFLHKKYQSNSRNITSNEAEVCALNDDILYYLDTKKEEIDFRKSFDTPYGERKYFTETFSLSSLTIDEDGMFDGLFLANYEEHVKKERLSLDRILSIPIEDGLEEEYFEFSYVYMNSLEEIWILPKLRMALEDQEFNEKAEKNRENFIQECNQELLKMNDYERVKNAELLKAQVNLKLNVMHWLA